MTTKTLLQHRRVLIRFRSSIHCKDFGKKLNNTKSFKIIPSSSLSKSFELRYYQACIRKIIYDRQGGICFNSETYLHAFCYSFFPFFLTHESLSESGVIKLWDDKSFSCVKIKSCSKLIENLKYFRNYWDLKGMFSLVNSRISSRAKLYRDHLYLMLPPRI